MASSIEDITTKFPTKILPRIEGEPHKESIQKIITLLYGNVASFQTMLSGGKHSHIGLIMSASLYDTLAPRNVFIPPSNPGSLPEFPTSLDKETQKVYCNFCNMDDALNAQLTAHWDTMKDISGL